MSEISQTVKASDAWDCATKVFALASELELDACKFRNAGFATFATKLDSVASSMRLSARALAFTVPVV